MPHIATPHWRRPDAASILIYDGLTTLDAIGGYEVLARLPGMETEFVAAQRGIVAADTRRLGLAAFRDFSEVKATDILYGSGRSRRACARKGRSVSRYGPPARQDLDLDRRHLQWRRSAGRGRTAERPQGHTNWFYQDRLRAWGTEFVAERYHRDGKYVTGAGVSASIDTGLFLTSLIAGEQAAKTLQLGIEYYPAPPFPERGPEDVAIEIQERIRGFEAEGGKRQLALEPAFKGMFGIGAGNSLTRDQALRPALASRSRLAYTATMRLKSSIWVAAYLRRCQTEGVFGAVRRRGAEEAGAVFGQGGDARRQRGAVHARAANRL